MIRNMQKSIEEYDKHFLNGKTGQIYATDVLNIRDLSRGSGKDLLLDSITNALKAGFMIGYRCRKAEDARARKRSKALQ